MADLEEHAVRRDGGFLVRLVVLLAFGAAFGLWAMGHLTSRGFGGTAAGWLGESTGDVATPPR
jgi:hypothetical protein